MPKNIWLIDSSIYIFRSWFTWSDSLVNKQGKQINAVLGFIDFVDNLLEAENPKYIAFAFDKSLKSSHRKEIYPDYKGNRESAPEALRYQFQLCQQYIRCLGIVEASSSRYEADDLIATWAKQAERFIVVTADKDLTQLIGKDDLWCDYQKNVTLDYKAIINKFGVRPDQVADQLALAGDKADNIPGVPGVGMATAAKLLRHFETIDILLGSIDKIGKMKFRGAQHIQLQIQRYQEQIVQYKKLTAVVCDVPDLETDLGRKSIDTNALKTLNELLKTGSNESEKSMQHNPPKQMQ